MKSQQTLPDARTVALENANEALDLPILPKGYQFKSFEIYLGSQVDEPAYAMHDGKMIVLNVPENPDPILQMIGDDGPVFIAVDKQTLSSRIGLCGLPEFPTTGLEEIVNSFVGRE